MQGLYLIVDFSFAAAHSLQQLNTMLSLEIAMLQYRDKAARPAQQRERATQLKHLCHKHQIPFIINDNVQLANEIDADGVHLGESDMPPAAARALLGKDKIIGVSCYQSLAAAQTARNNGANYIALGTLFPSSTKPEAKQIDLQTFSDCCKALELPVCAIGGITDKNISQVLFSGADMAAIISHIWEASQPTEALAACIQAINSQQSK